MLPSDWYSQSLIMTFRQNSVETHKVRQVHSLTQSPAVPAIAYLPEEFSLLEIGGSYQRPWRKEVASSKLRSQALEALAVGVALISADFARITLPLCRDNS